jgi:hypothetical protein
MSKIHKILRPAVVGLALCAMGSQSAHAQTKKVSFNPIDYAAGQVLKRTLERRGYYCPSKPAFFPSYVLWYSISCARRAGG